MVDLGNCLADIGQPFTLAQCQQCIALQRLQRVCRLDEFRRTRHHGRDRGCNRGINAKAVEEIDQRTKRGGYAVNLIAPEKHCKQTKYTKTADQSDKKGGAQLCPHAGKWHHCDIHSIIPGQDHGKAAVLRPGSYRHV